MMNTNMIEVAGLLIELVRKQIKNLHIGVYPPAGRIRVAAPPAISEDAIRVAIVTRLGWIKKKQREFAGQAREPERRFISGETHYVLGRPLRLQVKPTGLRGSKIMRVGADRLLMTTPPDATVEQKAKWMANWYRENLREWATPRVQGWSAKLSVPMPNWAIRVMQTKSGSCNLDKRLIWLNLDLAKKSLQALDYVILHEMAHFVSGRHDGAFVAILDRNMPTWRQIRTDLNKLPLSQPMTP